MIPDLRLHGIVSGPTRSARRRRVVPVMVLAAVALLVACDKVPLFAPTGTTIRLYTNTQVLPINGTAEITASVLESGGNPVQNGTMVNFTTSHGTVTPTHVTVTAGTKTGTAKVTAVAVPTITLTGPTTTPTAGLTSTFTLNVTAGSGSAPIRNVYLDFGDGTNFSLGASSGSVSIPHVYRESGTFTVTASATDASGQSTSMSIPVVVFPAVPFTLTVTAPTGKSGVAMTLTATPGAGAPVIVSYVWDFGDGKSATTTIGSAPHTY